jgi:predicted ArsR family transcriptional regulator
VGRSLAGNQTSHAESSGLETRAEKALTALEAIGGAAHVEKEGERLFIKGANCPLAAAVVEHPEVCQLAESLLSEIIGATVRERCERDGSPRCTFEVTEK